MEQAKTHKQHSQAQSNKHNATKKHTVARVNNSKKHAISGSGVTAEERNGSGIALAITP